MTKVELEAIETRQKSAVAAHAGAGDAMGYTELVEKDIPVLIQTIRDLSNPVKATMCIYCQAVFDRGSDEENAKAIAEHIFQCDKSMLAQALIGVCGAIVPVADLWEAMKAASAPLFGLDDLIELQTGLNGMLEALSKLKELPMNPTLGSPPSPFQNEEWEALALCASRVLDSAMNCEPPVSTRRFDSAKLALQALRRVMGDLFVQNTLKDKTI